MLNAIRKLTCYRLQSKTEHVKLEQLRKDLWVSEYLTLDAQVIWEDLEQNPVDRKSPCVKRKLWYGWLCWRVDLWRSKMCHAGLELNPEAEIGSILSSSHLSPPTHFQAYSNLTFPYHLTEAVLVLLKVTPNNQENQWTLISPHPSLPICI